MTPPEWPLTLPGAIIHTFVIHVQTQLGDQDLINILLAKELDLVAVLPCQFNYRTDSACNTSLPWIMHGNR